MLVIRRGGGTALLYRDGLDVNEVFSAERSSFEVSEWLVEFGTVRLFELSSCIDQHTLRIIP